MESPTVMRAAFFWSHCIKFLFVPPNINYGIPSPTPCLPPGSVSLDSQFCSSPPLRQLRGPIPFFLGQLQISLATTSDITRLEIPSKNLPQILKLWLKLWSSFGRETRQYMPQMDWRKLVLHHGTRISFFRRKCKKPNIHFQALSSLF